MHKRILTIFFLIALPAAALAAYPMVSDIPNQLIDMNTSTPVLQFKVYDDTTPPNDLDLSYKSNNPILVPEDDAHITLGGSGKNRTVKVTPVPGKWGIATIYIIVTDKDGDTNQDAFNVEVRRPPR